MYELTEVTKHYEQGKRAIVALDGVSITIADAEFLAIQGPTGQGKTTLLQMLGGLDRPTSGSIRFDGEDMTRMSEGKLTGLRGRSFGFVFQTFNLIPTLSAQENVETALVSVHEHAGERREHARAALASVGLSDRARHLPSELSGGEQQRVAIARALAKKPSVILADEPTGNLDERTRDEIMDLLEGLWSERKQTLVVVTHDSSVAKRAGRRAWIEEGRLRLAESDPAGSAGSGATGEDQAHEADARG